MKKIFFLIAFAALLSASCKKDSKSTDTIPPNTLSATINGVNETFNTGLTAKIITGPGEEIIDLYGTRLTDTSSDDLEVEVRSFNDYNPIVKGLYTSDPSNPNMPISLLIFYITDAGTINSASFGTGADTLTVNITLLTSTNIQGTFSGTLTKNSGNGVPQTITNGKFNVNITAN